MGHALNLRLYMKTEYIQIQEKSKNEMILGKGRYGMSDDTDTEYNFMTAGSELETYCTLEISPTR